ncbi:hypothetical protein [Achromobacter marplatensis]|uniref:hypothetical protein n=1 Tax=Achromobacter marplatensis TaxID=470868 RepID=UPI000277FF3D|nr:hypothetical protein [Achromobacter marplatensis]EJO27451.1 hypothetical protein QWC_31766 [Achromobacter marplatensis]
MTQAALIIGAVVMAAAGFLVALGMLVFVSMATGLMGRKVYTRLGRVYDLYVVEYWIKVATENGRKIPTRKDVEARLREQEKEA